MSQNCMLRSRSYKGQCHRIVWQVQGHTTVNVTKLYDTVKVIQGSMSQNCMMRSRSYKCQCHRIVWWGQGHTMAKVIQGSMSHNCMMRSRSYKGQFHRIVWWGQGYTRVNVTELYDEVKVIQGSMSQNCMKVHKLKLLNVIPQTAVTSKTKCTAARWITKPKETLNSKESIYIHIIHRISWTIKWNTIFERK